MSSECGVQLNTRVVLLSPFQWKALIPDKTEPGFEPGALQSI
jgi:hypothetical protein